MSKPGTIGVALVAGIVVGLAGGRIAFVEHETESVSPESHSGLATNFRDGDRLRSDEASPTEPRSDGAEMKPVGDATETIYGADDYEPLFKRLVDSELSAVHSNLLALSALRDDRIQNGIGTLETSLDLSVLVLDELRSEFGADDRVPKAFELIRRQRAQRLGIAGTPSEDEHIDRVIEQYGRAGTPAAATPDNP